MTNEQMTENMIVWAKDKLGIPEYVGWCLDFIEDALEQSNDIEIFGGDSAKESCEMYKDSLQIGIPERGAFAVNGAVHYANGDGLDKSDLIID